MARSAEMDYHRMSTVAAISSTKRIGSSTGGTSHSRTLDLEIFDILTAFWSRRERNALSHR